MAKYFAIILPALTLMAFNSKKAAQNTGNGNVVFAEEEELSSDRNLSNTQLATIYNALKPDAPISKFSDRATAIRRTFNAIKEAPIEVVDKDGAPVTEKAPKAPKAEKAPKEPKAPKAPKAPKEEGSKVGRAGNRDKYLVSVDGKNPMRASGWSGRTLQTIIDSGSILYSDLIDNKDGRSQAVNFALRTGSIVAVDEKGLPAALAALEAAKKKIAAAA